MGGSGLFRLQAKTEKDGKEGYVTLSGNQGTLYLEAYSALTATKKKVDAAIRDLYEATRDAGKHIEQKSQELNSVGTGPLADARAEIVKLKPRVTKVQRDYTSLKTAVAAGHK